MDGDVHACFHEHSEVLQTISTSNFLEPADGAADVVVDGALDDAVDGDADPLGFMSIFPLKLQPSSNATLRDTMLPRTVPVLRTINCSMPKRLPSTFPSTVIVFP